MTNAAVFVTQRRVHYQPLQPATKRQIVSVTLFDDPWNPTHEPEVYWCSKCRSPVLEHQHDVMQELPGGIPTRKPLRVRCKNVACPREYHFHVITLG